MRLTSTRSLFFLMVLTVSLTGCGGGGGGSAPVSTSTIDVHVHATNGPTSSAVDLVNLLTSNDITLSIMMQPPIVGYQEPDNRTQTIMDLFAGYPNSFRYMYGGSELNPFLFATGYSGVVVPISAESIYLYGGSDLTTDQIALLNAMRTDPAAYLTEFQNRAVHAAESGLYVGFGELGPEHYSRKSGQPQITYHVNCDFMKVLSNIADLYDMVLDLHIEATAVTIPELALLLDFNPNTKIIWDHAGWSNTGLATAAVFTQMLADHPNLYLNLKMRASQDGEDTSPVDSSGNLKSEWLTLLTTYADRIMVGTDAKYWTDPSSTIQEDFDDGYSALNAMLLQLPAATAAQIRSGTATTLFGL